LIKVFSCAWTAVSHPEKNNSIPISNRSGIKKNLLDMTGLPSLVIGDNPAD
jgi:hypothetical protein